MSENYLWHVGARGMGIILKGGEHGANSVSGNFNDFNRGPLFWGLFLAYGMLNLGSQQHSEFGFIISSVCQGSLVQGLYIGGVRVCHVFYAYFFMKLPRCGLSCLEFSVGCCVTFWCVGVRGGSLCFGLGDCFCWSPHQ